MQDVNYLISKNTGLIFEQIKKFHLLNDPEAESAGYWALYNAVLTFESEKKIEFSTYATVCIYNALGNYVRELNRKRQLEVISYNEPVYETNELVDFIPGPCSAEDACLGEHYLGYIIKVIDEEHDKLKNTTIWQIVDIWRLSDFTKGTKDIANEVGVSQSYVSQVLNRFRYSLRKRLEEYNA